MLKCRLHADRLLGGGCLIMESEEVIQTWTGGFTVAESEANGTAEESKKAFAAAKFKSSFKAVEI